MKRLLMSLGSLRTIYVFSLTGDVVTVNGEEKILTDKTGRRFRKAENSSSAGAHVSGERSGSSCLLPTQQTIGRVLVGFFRFAKFEKYASFAYTHVQATLMKCARCNNIAGARKTSAERRWLWQGIIWKVSFNNSPNGVQICANFVQAS